MSRRKKLFSYLGDRGFSLVEITVGLVVIGIMVLALSTTFITINYLQTENSHFSLATRLGEEKIESLRNNHYNALAVSPPAIDFTAELPPELAEPRSAQVTVSEPSPGIKRLDVVITWREGSRTKDIRLSSLIGNIGIAQ